MNRQRSIALFAGIAAIAMITIGLTGVSATPLMASSIIPQSEDRMAMLGHVEFIVRDSNDSIIAYNQGDNSVVDVGKDCVAEQVFGTDNSGACVTAGSTFQYVAIGNGTEGSTPFTIPAKSDLATMSFTGSDGCADETDVGEMARQVTVPTISLAADNSTSTGTKVELDTPLVFTFDTLNATSVKQSAIFNGAYSSPLASTTNVCGSLSGGEDDMFAIQALSSGAGITVTDGDSLDVKWTITIG